MLRPVAGWFVPHISEEDSSLETSIINHEVMQRSIPE
jgi:hypothetical protein